jgi:hypothetical protein
LFRESLNSLSVWLSEDISQLEMTANSTYWMANLRLDRTRIAEGELSGEKGGLTACWTIRDKIQKNSFTKFRYGLLHRFLPQQHLIDLPHGTDTLYRKSLDFVLNEYQSGYLSVNSVPDGGKVSIDNLFTGEVTPALFKSIPIGTHTVTVTGVNTSKTFDATVTSLDLTNLTADFTPVEKS